MQSNLLAFVGTCLLLAVIPGPSTVVLLRQSVKGGRRAAYAAVFGQEAGILVWSVAAAFGLSALLLVSDIAYQVLRVAGVCVLVWMGIRTMLSAGQVAGPVDTVDSEEDAGPGRAFRSGLLVNLTNPKLAVFAISLLPQFVPPNEQNSWIFLLLALLWVVSDMAVYLVIATMISRFAGWLRRAKVRKNLDRVSGGVLIALGLRLALE